MSLGTCHTIARRRKTVWWHKAQCYSNERTRSEVWSQASASKSERRLTSYTVVVLPKCRLRDVEKRLRLYLPRFVLLDFLQEGSSVSGLSFQRESVLWARFNFYIFSSIFFIDLLSCEIHVDPTVRDKKQRISTLVKFDERRVYT